jgi:hypothetical protein
MIQQSTYAVPREDLGVAFHEFDNAAEGFVAEQVLPVMTVQKKAATISVIKRTNIKRADAKHANGAVFNRVSLIAADLDYSCQDYGLEEQVTDTDRENYINDFDADMEATQSIVRKIKVEQEIRAATALFNATTFSGPDLYTDVSAAPWDNIASGVMGHVNAAVEKVRRNTGAVADSMLIGPVTLNNILANTGILARFPGVTVLTYDLLMANLAAILNLRNLFVGKSVYDSAKEGQVFASGDIFSDDYALIFKRQVGATKANPGLGRILLWDPISGELTPVESYREEQTKSDIIRCNQFCQEKLFDPYFGHLLKVDA